jgi:hypothetical protein
MKMDANRTRLTIAMSMLLALPLGAAAQDLTADPFVAEVIGEWEGEGEYDGNRLSLTRSWTLELGDRFLRADMRVGMPNGASFGALMYFRSAGAGVYDIIWMDGLGRRQSLRATRDPESGIVSTSYLDDLAEGGPEWRTWELEATGVDSYVERLYQETAEGRVLLTVFSFERARGR